MDNAVSNITKRFAYRVGDRLPKIIRILYYIVLFLSMIYFIYRFFEWFLKSFQKLGAFIFEPKMYWALVVCFFALIIGAFILAQFILGLDPVGHFTKWLENLLITLKSRYA
ncbi:MAG: hypothetical protein ABII85_00270 [Bacillota bacterium]